MDINLRQIKKKFNNSFFSKYSKDLNFDNFKQSSLELSLQKVNNDSYLKVFDQNAQIKI